MTDSRAHILVVDDDPYLLELLVDTLNAIGYTTTAATDGLEAIEMVGKQHFDLVVTDIKMPGMDGITLLRKIKRRYKDLPVLFITGVAAQEVIGDVEADGLLAKPFRIQHIEQMIERALNRPAGRRTARRILIVGGDSDTRQLISQALTGKHYLPFAVDNEEAAIKELENGKIDIVLTSSDGIGNGEALAQQIRTAQPGVRLVLMRGPERASAKTPVEEQDISWADGIIDRPVRGDQLLEVLAAVSSD